MKPTLHELYHHGNELFDAGKYAEAEPILKEVIAQNPKYADVLNKLGIIAHLSGRLQSASEFF